MKYVISASLIIAGIIHLMPLPGLFGAERLQALYGIAIDDSNLLILMRHRAVLFGILGGFLVFAAFRPSWQPPALIAGWVSVLSFLILAWTDHSYSAAIGRIVMGDVVALVCLVIASLLCWRQAKS